jgi:tRNA threonylcarbamoyladenosine biosynthesis protein TsaE
MIEVVLADETATERLGARFAELVRERPGGMVYLRGDLGAGKTTLMRGLLRSLGVRGTVRSPTYTLIESYEVGDRVICHADLYRLQAPAELYALGLDDYPLPQTWWWVEWPERGAGVLPAADISIELQVATGGRLALIDGRRDAAWLQENLSGNKGNLGQL